ncbi:CoB--CoM heterodisulfide reductase iron-sulfur subunit B family protein [Chloroflexota bacterium]
MDVSYYPGCSLEGTAVEYGESIDAIAKTLEVNLKELHDWNCCGASSAHVTNHMLAIALAARNLYIADKEGTDLVVPCAACYSRLKAAEKELLSGQEIEGFSDKYAGNFHIKHITDFLWDDVGERAILEKLKKPLQGLNPVCYYGCLTTRPPKVTDAVNPEDPQAMDRLLQVLGANVVNWSYKTDCCGGSLVLTQPEIAKELIKKLLNVAEEAGADCIVTACPMCQSNMDTKQKEISHETGKEYKLPIFYLTELMGLAFGDSDAGKWLGRHMIDPRPLLKEKGLI